MQSCLATTQFRFLILLSYTKILRSFIMSHTSNINNAGWLYDANVNYLSGKHIPLFVGAVLVFLFLFLPYTFLLLFGQWLQAMSHCMQYISLSHEHAIFVCLLLECNFCFSVLIAQLLFVSVNYMFSIGVNCNNDTMFSVKSIQSDLICFQCFCFHTWWLCICKPNALSSHNFLYSYILVALQSEGGGGILEAGNQFIHILQ